jgi:hypothetical protein
MSHSSSTFFEDSPPENSSSPAEDLHRVTCRQRTFGGYAGARCKVIIHEYVGIEWANAALDPGFLDGFW